MVNSDYTFDISLSRTAYRDKNDIDWKNVTYGRLNNANFPMFEHFIKCGHTFAYCFNSTNFTQREKTKANWSSTSLIFVDIDDCGVEINSFIENLTFPPTLYYTTQNHTNECPRFRMVYCFSENITDQDTFGRLYDSIVYQMEIDNNWKNKDNCGRSVNQQFAGNTSLDIIYNNNYFIYDINEFDNILPDTKSAIVNHKKREDNNIDTVALFQNKEYIEDYFKLNDKSLLFKYNEIYPVFFKTELNENEDMPYTLIPSDYIEIKYKYNNTGNTTNIKRLEDGQHRRRQIFIHCMLRRLIKRDITPEHLLQNALWELTYIIDNSKDPISKQDLMDIVVGALKSDLSNYEGLPVKDKRRFKVNKSYCDKYGLTAQQVRQMSSKLLKMEDVMSMYDPSLTDKQNIEVMKENGVKVSLRTLKTYRKELGINKYNK